MLTDGLGAIGSYKRHNQKQPVCCHFNHLLFVTDYSCGTKIRFKKRGINQLCLLNVHENVLLIWLIFRCRKYLHTLPNTLVGCRYVFLYDCPYLPNLMMIDACMNQLCVSLVARPNLFYLLSVKGMLAWADAQLISLFELLQAHCTYL